ncbi:MAG: hypothetical protein ABUK01_05965 [Leptospirales bacterium]
MQAKISLIMMKISLSILGLTFITKIMANTYKVPLAIELAELFSVSSMLLFVICIFFLLPFYIIKKQEQQIINAEAGEYVAPTIKLEKPTKKNVYSQIKTVIFYLIITGVGIMFILDTFMSTKNMEKFYINLIIGVLVLLVPIYFFMNILEMWQKNRAIKKERSQSNGANISKYGASSKTGIYILIGVVYIISILAANKIFAESKRQTLIAQAENIINTQQKSIDTIAKNLPCEKLEEGNFKNVKTQLTYLSLVSESFNNIAIVYATCNNGRQEYYEYNPPSAPEASSNISAGVSSEPLRGDQSKCDFIKDVFDKEANEKVKLPMLYYQYNPQMNKKEARLFYPIIRDDTSFVLLF